MTALYPPALFVHPENLNWQDTEALTRQTVAVVLRFLHQAAKQPLLPVWDGWLPDELLPASGRPLDALLGDLARILERSMNPANPRFMGHMDTVPTLASSMGEWIAAALNNNMLSVEMSPLLTRLEERCMRELAGWFGLGDKSAGLMLSGGSLANLQALVVARNDAFGCQAAGTRKLSKRPVVLAGANAHTSLQKAAMVSGLGSDAVVKVAVDRQFRMQPQALRDAIESSRLAGDAPFCVVATAGSTVTGSVDPLDEIARVCAENGLWLHVDAAYGGAVILSAEHRAVLEGIDKADSVTFNPQKWLYVPKTCATLLFRDRERWCNAFRVEAPYVASCADTVNLGEYSLQGTRHAEILKLWFGLQYAGRGTQVHLIEQCMTLTRHFIDEIAARPHLELLCTPQLNLACFRDRRIADPRQRAAHNRALQSHLRETGASYFSLTEIDGEPWLRAVLLNPHLTSSTISSVFRSIDAFRPEGPAA
jgi:glutamate/tyrosine decarboxylase-like PLP-dependent enzyme